MNYYETFWEFKYSNLIDQYTTSSEKIYLYIFFLNKVKLSVREHTKGLKTNHLQKHNYP